MRKRTDQLFARTLGPRELEALRRIEESPGLTIGELAGHMDLKLGRAWQIVARLEARRVVRLGGDRANRRAPWSVCRGAS